MTTSNLDLADLANRHLWGQFSSLGKSVDGMTVIERGEGCYVWDSDGKRFISARDVTVAPSSAACRTYEAA